MMGAELIRDISNVAAYRAAEEGRLPLVPWRDSVAEDVRHAPFLGEYIPAGWREATWTDLPLRPRESAIPWGNGDRALFMVDSSGFGSSFEPALTLDELAEYVLDLLARSVDLGLGIVEAGQFQIVMAVYLRDINAPGKPAPSVDEVICPECRTVHDGLEECAETDDDESFDEEVSRCPACGDVIDYCQGHGEIGDPAGRAILDAHDAGDHSGCHPAGCDEAGAATNLTLDGFLPHIPGTDLYNGQDGSLECDDCGRTDGSHDYEVEH